MTDSPASPSPPAGLPPPSPPPVRFALGHPALDAALGGGLARGRLHEVLATDAADLAAAAGFALMLALRAGGRRGTITWIAEAAEARRQGALYGPGVAELGADPARLLLVTVPDEAALLRIAADVVRSPAAGTAVIAPAGVPRRLDLTASRRLTLFAERSGVTAILLGQAGAERSTAASTRWRIAAAPSSPLDADAPGRPAFAADLVRRRDGPPSAGWRLEWDRDAAAFAPRADDAAAALSGTLPAEPGGGRVEAERRPDRAVG